MTQPADISPHRVFPPMAKEDQTLVMGDMIRGTGVDFAPPPPSLQRIPPERQDMIDAEQKAGRKRKRR